MEDSFESGNSSTETVEELDIKIRKEQEEEIDLYSDVLDQTDEIAIRAENLKVHITKENERNAPVKIEDP